jgi:hypothetical protein
MKKSSYDYGTDDNNAWTFYNHVTHALKKAHPRDWLSDQQNFHDFMITKCINNNSVSLNNFELNTDNTDLGITMRDDEHAIEIDEDISHSILVQDVHMGR